MDNLIKHGLKEMADEIPEPDVDKAWKKLSNKNNKRKTFRYGAVAAALAIILVEGG